MSSVIHETILVAGLFGLAAGISPSAHTLLAIQSGVQYGLRRSFAVCVAGACVDGFIISLLSFAFLANAGAKFVTPLQLIGGIYLIRLALKNFKASKIIAVKDKNQTLLQIICAAFLVQLLNPNPYLFWSSVGFPYIAKFPSSSHLAAAEFFTGFFFVLVAVKMFLSAIAKKIGNFLSSDLYVYARKSAAVLLLMLGALSLSKGINHFL